VYLVVQQLAPVCRTAGRVKLGGHAGVNEVVLRPRVAHHTLEPGTYRYSVKTRAGSRGKSVIVVVVADDAAASSSDLASARRANTCGGVLGASASGTSGVAARGGGSGSSGGTSAGSGSYRPPAHKSGSASSSSAAGAGGGAQSPAPTPKAQAAPLLNPTQGPHSWVRMLLLVGFVLAALLLAAAALPAAAARGSRTGEVVARHRSEIGLVGGATLLAFALAYVIATIA
jgi:hypothetical protein